MLQIYNTLSRSIEEFDPLKPPQVGMYSCGPTVYDYQHIGHLRRYVGDDILVKALKMNGYDTKHVMNITDVGHLVSDADSGEDKMEKGARKFGMSVWDIAKKFEQQFFDSLDALHIKKADVIMHATDYIEDQIALIQVLEKKSFTYKTTDGIYFNTAKFPDYFNLSGQNPEELKAGARVEMIKGKRNVTDFALWKFSPKGEKRQMEWKSPWGFGFPGWHIECSAMAMRELGLSFDIHTGGIDHITIHHTNEIAQAEAATGKPFVKYWVHHAFLLVEGQKMSKSLGNIYTVSDIVEKGFDPMALRYLYLQTHYRQEMNFTFDALAAAQTALQGLYNEAMIFGQQPELSAPSGEPSKKMLKNYHAFEDAVNNDLDMPVAIARLHDGIKDAEDDFDKLFFLEKADEVLGLQLRIRGTAQWQEHERLNIKKTDLTQEEQAVLAMVSEREQLRKQRQFHQADQLRNKVIKMGYEITDNKKGKSTIRKI